MGQTINPPAIINPPPQTLLSLAPAGQVDGYGTTTWIPEGYPLGARPYITTDGRLVLRPLVPPTAFGSDMNNPNPTALAYVLAALQAAVIQYGPNQYNVDYNMPNVANGRADIINSLLSPHSTPALWLAQRRASNGDIDWFIPPPAESGLEDLQGAAVKYIPAVTNTVLNSIVPGLGTKLAAITGTTTNPNIQGPLTAQVDSQYGSLVSTTEDQLLATTNTNLILYAVAVIIIIIIIFLTVKG